MKKIKYLLLLIPFLFISNVNADNISSFSNRFYWCRTDGANDETCNWTNYHSNSSGYSLNLYGTENDQPTYTYFEYLSGFQTQVSKSFKKGVSYTFTVNFSFTSLADDEFRPSSFSRWSNLSYAYSSNGVVTSASSNYVKGTCDKYSGTDYCTYYGTATYSIVPSSDLSSITIGSYVSGGASYGFYKHYLTSSVVISSLDIVTNSDDTIINQNQTIINQNQTIINQNQTMIDKSNQQIEEQKKQLEEQKKTNDTLKDSNIQEAQDSAGGFFNDFTTDTHGLTAIITAPLTLISSITSKSCSPLVLPLPFVDKDLTLPCMGAIYSQYFGSFLSIYQLITFGIVAYWVCVRIFNLVKDFKNPDHDEIEVLDL